MFSFNKDLFVCWISNINNQSEISPLAGIKLNPANGFICD